MLRKGLLAVIALAASSMGYASLGQTAPELTSSVDQLVHDHLLGWSDAAACERHPAACLAAQRGKLAATAEEIGASLDGIRREEAHVGTLLDDDRQGLARNGLFLESGRDLLQHTDAGTRGWPVEFAGRKYADRASLSAQLRLLVQERETMQATIAEIEGLDRDLRDRERTLQIERAKVQSKLDILPAQLQQLASRRLLEGFRQTTSTITALLEDARASLDRERAEPLITTTAGLRARIERAPDTDMDADYQEFLAHGLGAIPSRSGPSSGGHE